MKRTKLLRQALLLSLTMLASCILPLVQFAQQPLTVSAVSTDYPPQLMNLANKDGSSVLTENGTTDGSALTLKTLGNDLSSSWRFDRVGKDSKGTFFKIVNAQSGRLLTPQNYSVTAGNSVILYGSESAKSQHWYAVPVKQDHLGNDLYYKIVNYENTSLALTQGSGGMTLANYSGADSQLWLLNADGLQGFAGYCKNDQTGNIKASDIGGLFGEVVEVSNFSDLSKYATSDTPYTIVVTADIKVTNLTKDSSGRYYCPDGRIYVHSNKTIIGSYAKHTLYNVQFCTSSGKGVGNNLIIKNFDLQHDKESNGNDSIVVYFGSGENLWVDHCTFTGHADYNKASTGLPDYDKFLACCYDADFCTVSDCAFGLHEYGLILGYPDDTADVKNKYDNFPRMSIISNSFNKTLTRGPGLMRWGYFHSLNNYVNQFSMAYTVHSGCDIYAENCVYENGGNVICDWNSITYAGAYAESGSIFNSCNRTVQGQGTSSNPSYSKPSGFRPAGNYSYVSISAQNVKNYCGSYSGVQSNKNNMMYLRFAKAGVPSAGYSEAPSGPMGPVAASFSEGAAFRIRNVNSGLYLQIAGGAAENGANIQQWGTDNSSVHDIWKLYSAGDSRYYIVSCVGDGATYVLDVAGRKADNGTNIDLYQYNGGTNQQFLFAENSDGSYTIYTGVSGDKSTVEVADASTASGANVQQWEKNGASCQNWILESAADPGVSMKTDLLYTFENANSGLVMDIENGAMNAGTNVRQWESNGFDCQKWTLTAFGSGNYYWIRSQSDPAYALKAEGSGNAANIDLAAYSSSDSAELFRFTKNLDGTYSILSHSSNDACLVEVDGASKDGGANIQQYAPTNSPCQKWNLLTEPIPVVTTTTTETTTTTTTTTTTVPVPVMTLLGDADCNGDVNVLDAVLISRLIAEDSTLDETVITDVGKLNADCNRDSVCTAPDLERLLQYLAHKIPSL